MRNPALFALSGLYLAPSALAGVIPRDSGTATTPSPASLKADIRADTDRDGFVDIEGFSDVDGKTIWNATYGAIFLPNIGDTDKRCSNALLKGPAVSNERLDACHDASDNVLRNEEFLAPLLTVPMIGLPDDASGRVYLKDPVQRSNVRIFYQANENSTWTYVDGNYTFSAAALREGLVLGIDGRDTRRPNGWDGRALVTFDVKSSNSTSSDSVMLRVAPVLTHSHFDSVQQVLGAKANDTGSPLLVRFNEQLQKAVNESGLEEDIYFFSGSDDIWVQDFMEPGFASMPGPCGPISVRIMIRSPQDDRVAGRQLFEYYRDTGIGAVQQLGGKRDEINSGGNIETIPPYEFNGTSWPAGRLIISNHGQQQHFLVPFFQAQETQDPLLIDTDWLAIGHVDEVLQFIPVDSERGWVVMVNDPTAGVKMLQDIKASGQAPCNNFGCEATPVESTTINEVLANVDLMSIQKLCAERVEKNLRILKEATGVTDEEIIRLPAMFRRDFGPFAGNASDNSTGDFSNVPTNSSANTDVLKVGSMWPNMVNGLVMSGFDTYIMPNPWGPLVNGTDILAAKAKQEYGRVGMNVVLIDDWNTHHNGGGEIHCGTNTVRDMDAEWYMADFDGDDGDEDDEDGDFCAAYGDDGDDGDDDTDGDNGDNGYDAAGADDAKDTNGTPQ